MEQKIYQVTICNSDDWKNETEILGNHLTKEQARRLFKHNQFGNLTCFVIDIESGQILEGVNRRQENQMSIETWNHWD